MLRAAALNAAHRPRQAAGLNEPQYGRNGDTQMPQHLTMETEAGSGHRWAVDSATGKGIFCFVDDGLDDEQCLAIIEAYNRGVTVS